MQPERFETIGGFLAIRWSDGVESIISLEEMRRQCPCAQCSGETDVTGQLHRVGPEPQYFSTSFQVVSWEKVGHYAVQPKWADGHETGIYTFDQLRRLGEEGARDEPA